MKFFKYMNNFILLTVLVLNDMYYDGICCILSYLKDLQ